MAEQEKRQAQRRTREADEEIVDVGDPETAEEVAEHLDDLLEEIDSVLEENAEEFVKNYVQKGGQ